MTDNTVRRGRALVVVVVVSAILIVGALWLRAITIEQTTDRICEKVDRLTQALITAATDDGQRTDPVRLRAFAEDAACDPGNLTLPKEAA